MATWLFWMLFFLLLYCGSTSFLCVGSSYDALWHLLVGDPDLWLRDGSDVNFCPTAMGIKSGSVPGSPLLLNILTCSEPRHTHDFCYRLWSVLQHLPMLTQFHCVVTVSVSMLKTRFGFFLFVSSSHYLTCCPRLLFSPGLYVLTEAFLSSSTLIPRAIKSCWNFFWNVSQILSLSLYYTITIRFSYDWMVLLGVSDVSLLHYCFIKCPAYYGFHPIMS